MALNEHIDMKLDAILARFIPILYSLINSICLRQTLPQRRDAKGSKAGPLILTGVTGRAS